MQQVLGKIGLGPKKEIHDLAGRVALVTGGTLGIGFEVSRGFAKVGAKVIMVSRKEEHGQEAIDKIEKEILDEGKPKPQLEFISCDLGNLKEVKSVFSGIHDRENRLDIVVCSSGINVNQYGEDHDGIDRHFGVNWLGHFYLLNLLFPLIRKTSKLPDTPAPRIIMESSDMHKTAPSDVKFSSLAEINNPDFGHTHLYARTKLAMILGTKFGLLERVIKPNNDNIYAVSVHPGAVNTDMQQQWKDAYPGVTGQLLTYAMLFIGRSPEQGSFSALYAATSPEIEEKNWNGVYLVDPSKLGSETDQAKDPNLGTNLWNLSHEIVKEKVGPDALKDWNSTKP